MNKTIAAGILMEYEGLFLIGHATPRTGTTGSWGILKGKVDKDESLVACAMREFKEESGVDLYNGFIAPGVIMHPRPFFKYDVKDKRKTVYVFWFIDNGVVFDNKLSCPSLVPGTDKPEIDDYKWVTPEQAIILVVPHQVEMFRQVKKLIERK